MDEVGGRRLPDHQPGHAPQPPHVTEITDGLVPTAELASPAPNTPPRCCATTCANSDSRFTEGDPMADKLFPSLVHDFTTTSGTRRWNDGMPEREVLRRDAQAMEKACFDYIMIEDTLMVSEAYGGNSEVYLKYATMAPKHTGALAAIWPRHVEMGVVATDFPTFYPPVSAPRLASTLDSIAEGTVRLEHRHLRRGRSAQNFGRKAHEHDLATTIADEYVDLVCQLWDSWEPDAVIRDRETTRTRTSRRSTQFTSREVLQVPRPTEHVCSPQGRPVFVQAGGSPRGGSSRQVRRLDHRRRQRGGGE